MAWAIELVGLSFHLIVKIRIVYEIVLCCSSSRKKNYGRHFLSWGVKHLAFSWQKLMHMVLSKSSFYWECALVVRNRLALFIQCLETW